MNMLKQETQKQNKENQQFKDRGTNEKYILYFNLNGRKKDRASNIKLARQITMLKKCANYHSENTVFNISNDPQTWRIGELSAPCVHILYNI